MPTRAWFPTFIYHEPLLRAGLQPFNASLADECRNLRDYDAAGRKWSAKNYPGGYTCHYVRPNWKLPVTARNG